jgi:hypothetical protein
MAKLGVPIDQTSWGSANVDFFLARIAGKTPLRTTAPPLVARLAGLALERAKKTRTTHAANASYGLWHPRQRGSVFAGVGAVQRLVPAYVYAWCKHRGFPPGVYASLTVWFAYASSPPIRKS